MAEQRQNYVGGSFAPPLTDKTLSKYKAAIAKMPEGPEKSAVAGLLSACEKWWELPEPAKSDGKPHPSGQGVIIRLQDDHAQALDEHLPWDHELLAMHGHEADGAPKLLERIQAEEVQRNSEKVSQWYRDVVKHVTDKHFPKPGLYQMVTTALQKAGEFIGLFGEDAQAKLEEYEHKVNECQADILKAFANKDLSDVPYPKLESTELRDMAFHLLWHVKELCAGREPMTTDKL